MNRDRKLGSFCASRSVWTDVVDRHPGTLSSSSFARATHPRQIRSGVSGGPKERPSTLQCPIQDVVMVRVMVRVVV
jgi:hypothetical protein